MNRIDRLFAILTLLQSRKYVPAEKIAERFDISIRTVYRDVKALSASGIPVSFEPARGYFIVQGYFLPPVAFSTEEANALLLMERLASGFADRSIQKHYGTALQKVKSVLRNSQKEQLEHLNENTQFQMPECFVNDSEHLSLLQDAISNRRILRIQYANKQKEASERLVEAIGLIYYAFSWHLIAWCHLRKEYRDFRVSRIASAAHTGEAFRKQDHLALKDYMHQLPVDY